MAKLKADPQKLKEELFELIGLKYCGTWRLGDFTKKCEEDTSSYTYTKFNINEENKPTIDRAGEYYCVSFEAYYVIIYLQNTDVTFSNSKEMFNFRVPYVNQDIMRITSIIKKLSLPLTTEIIQEYAYLCNSIRTP
jgi:hypothetical protein